LAAGTGFYNQGKTKFVLDGFETGVVENEGGGGVIEAVFGLFFVLRSGGEVVLVSGVDDFSVDDDGTVFLIGVIDGDVPFVASFADGPKIDKLVVGEFLIL